MSTLTHGTIDHLNALVIAIGEGNASRGFHEEGDRLRKALADAEQGLKLGGEGAQERYAHAEAALRNYYMAKLALIGTEISEAVEQLRSGFSADYAYYELPGADGRKISVSASDLDDERTLGDLDALGVDLAAPRKPEGVPSEIIDVIVRAVDLIGEVNKERLADSIGINFGETLDEKLTYNATRGHRHGGRKI